MKTISKNIFSTEMFQRNKKKAYDEGDTRCRIMQAPKNLRYVYPLIRFHLTYGHANRTEFRHSIFVVLCFFFWSCIFTVDTQFSLRVKRF